MLSASARQDGDRGGCRLKALHQLECSLSAYANVAPMEGEWAPEEANGQEENVVVGPG